MLAKKLETAIKHAVDGAIKDAPKVSDTRMYIFVGRLIGALEVAHPDLAEKVQSLMNDAGVAEGAAQ